MNKLRHEIGADHLLYKKNDAGTDALVLQEAQNQSEGYEANIDKHMAARLSARHHEALSITQKNEILDHFCVRTVENDAFQAMLDGERLRTKTLHQILRRINLGTGERAMGVYTVHMLPEFVNDLYFTFWYYDYNRSAMRRLRSLFVDGGVPPGNSRQQIVKLISDYYQNHQKHHKILDSLDKNFSPDTIRSIRTIFEEEEDAFSKMVRQAVEISKEKNLPPIPKTPVGIPPPPTADLLIRPKTSLLQTGMTKEAAEALLTLSLRESEIEQTWKIARRGGDINVSTLYHQALFDFFTSPDVFPKFRYYRNTWDKKEFYQAVNCHLANKSKISTDILEAFVFYCHHVGQLFKIGYWSRRIIPHDQGWEICEEQPIGGPLRNLTYEQQRPPRGIGKVEQTLLNNVTAFTNLQPERRVSDLMLKINTWSPKRFSGLIPRASINEEEFINYVQFWSLTGRLFVFADP